jgi:glycosyltransferase involved in cell wall biosynthesis
VGTPLVSVCVPTRNHARYLGEAIASVLEQDVDGLEVLVHDDASADDTTKLVEQLKDPRVHYRRHPRPLGVAENRNTCLAAARGRYVAWLDADDSYLPESLARRLAVLEEHPEVGLVHGSFEVLDEDGAPLLAWPAPFDGDAIEPGSTAFHELIASNEITTSTVVARRSCHERFHSGGSSSDWEMWLRAALRGDVAYTGAPVARYRQHAATISRAASWSGERLRCDLRVARRILREERARISDRRGAVRTARAALAAKALVHAGDAFTGGRRVESLRSVALAGRLAPRTTGDLIPELLLATARGDDFASYRCTKALLGRLADRLEGTRYGARLRRAAANDPAWDATLARISETLRRVVPPAALVGSVTKWDPTLLRLSRRRGRQFPDRRALPDGYPRDSATAIAHLESLRREGLSHLVFPSASFWWLEHYAGFARHLGDRYVLLWRDDDCVVYDLAGS